MRLILENWYKQLLAELDKTVQLRIISPFLSEQIIRNLHGRFNFDNFQLITRYNLVDFASNVSNLAGLKFAVERGAQIYGIKDLHSKVYLFDQRATIISSANLTRGGLIDNYECGLYTTDQAIIVELDRYFNFFKNIGGNPLTVEECERWKEDLEQKSEICNTPNTSLPDYGKTGAISATDQIKSYYIKIFGTSRNRKNLETTIKEEVDRALCHYACGFSSKKKPRKINNGDIIYMARMTEDPRDLAIFGRAEAIRFDEKRDKATENEIKQRPWKKDYPIYLRVRNPVFIDGKFGDCVLLGDLINELDFESFPSTKRKVESGARDVNPRLSWRQQPYVQLTEKAVEWLEPKFNRGLKDIGTIPPEFLYKLPQSDIKL